MPASPQRNGYSRVAADNACLPSSIGLVLILIPICLGCGPHLFRHLLLDRGRLHLLHTRCLLPLLLDRESAVLATRCLGCTVWPMLLLPPLLLLLLRLLRLLLPLLLPPRLILRGLSWLPRRSPGERGRSQGSIRQAGLQLLLLLPLLLALLVLLLLPVQWIHSLLSSSKRISIPPTTSLAGCSC